MKLFARNKASSFLAKRSGAHLSLFGRGRREASGEGAFSITDCAIWNDITRALDAKPKASK